MNPQQSSALWEAQVEASGKGGDVLLSWDWWFLPKGGGAVKLEPFRPNPHWGACELHTAGMLLT